MTCRLQWPNTTVDSFAIGQVFYDDGDRIIARRCWMCIHLNENGLPYLLPMLPTQAERAQFLAKWDNCGFDMTFLERENGVIGAASTNMVDFLRDLPEFDPDTPLTDVLSILKECVKDRCTWVMDNEGDPFERRLYLAMTPKDRFVYLEFDDNCYRPEMYKSTIPSKTLTLYDDFVETARSWEKLSELKVEKIFEEIDDATIDALNEGLDSYTHFQQESLPALTAKHKFNLVDHLKEIHAVPTLFMLPKYKIVAKYDILADWKTVSDGSVRANLGEFIACHAPGTGDVGRLYRRRAKAVAAKKS